MRVAYVGNFEPSHSTENEVRKAWLRLGVDVEPIQEQHADWHDLGDTLEADLLMWTRTADLDRAPDDVKLDALARLERRGIPSLAYHLDRWFGLHREDAVRTEPFFRCHFVCTADGGHDDAFHALGVNHHWFPPAVSEFECDPGTARAHFRSELAFVGSWQNGYHREWQHRPELVAFLRRTYGDRCRFWPKKHNPAVRGADLRDLYASVDIAVGDSCLSGGITHYWSDRIPETLGRGGFLIHPYVEGLDEHFMLDHHLVVWPLGEWDHLRGLIEHYLARPEERERIAAAGREHVLALHTYTVRMQQVRELVGQ